MSLEKRRTYSTLDLNCRCRRLFSESYEQRIDRDSHFNLRGRNLQHSLTFRLGFRGGSRDQILRRKDPGLLKAVEHLSKNEIAIGVPMLLQRGRVTEVVDPPAAHRSDS